MGATVNKNSITKLIDDVESNNDLFSDISDRIITAYTSDLDKLMSDLRVDAIENEASDLVLEKYALELSNMLYFMGQRLEGVGIKEDLSRMTAKEAYNATYLNPTVKNGDKKPTVAELTATAEDASKYEFILNSIYSRAYKQIKFKVDAGYEMLGTLKKIISKRMQEAQAATFAPRERMNTGEEVY